MPTPRSSDQCVFGCCAHTNLQSLYAEQKQAICTLSAILCCHKQLFNGSINQNIHMCSCRREAFGFQETDRKKSHPDVLCCRCQKEKTLQNISDTSLIPFLTNGAQSSFLMLFIFLAEENLFNSPGGLAPWMHISVCVIWFILQ